MVISSEIQKACDDLLLLRREAILAAKKAILENFRKLQAENVSLKEIADLALDIHTRDKLYVKEKWGVMGINAEKLLVRKIEDLTEE